MPSSCVFKYSQALQSPFWVPGLCHVSWFATSPISLEFLILEFVHSWAVNLFIKTGILKEGEVISIFKTSRWNAGQRFKKKKTKLKKKKHLSRGLNRCADWQKEPCGHHYLWDEKRAGGISIHRLWQRRQGWNRKQVWAFGKMSAVAILCGKESLNNLFASSPHRVMRRMYIGLDTDRQWVTGIDKRGRKYRPLSTRWWGEV